MLVFITHVRSSKEDGFLFVFPLQFMIHMYLLHVYVVICSGGFYVAVSWPREMNGFDPL